MEKLDKPTQEQWFAFWVQDLIDTGYILAYITDDPAIELFPEVYVKYKEGKKKKKRSIFPKMTYKYDGRIVWADKALGVFFNPQMELFYDIPDGKCYFSAIQYSEEVPTNTGPVTTSRWVTIVDVKAPPGYGGSNCSDVSFAIKKRIVFKKMGVIVNKVFNNPNSKIKPSKAQLKKNPNLVPKFKLPKPYLWMRTFTPTRYFFTDKNLDKRSIKNWNPITLEEFLRTSI